MIETKESKMIKQALKQEINELSITINGMILLKTLISLTNYFETNDLTELLFNICEGLIVFKHDYNQNGDLLITTISELLHSLNYNISSKANFEDIRNKNYYYRLLEVNHRRLIKRLV